MKKDDDKRTLTPKLRFPEFRDAPGWQLGSLAHTCHMQAGKFVSASEIFDTPRDGLFPCYGGNGLRGYTKTFTHAGRFSLIGRQGALCGNVNLCVGQFHATEHALVVTPKSGVNVDWLCYSLRLLNLNQYAIGQAQPGLSVQVLEKVSVVIPTEQLEQKKVADCLSSLDELIAAEGRKLAALKAHKKGLMQQLFPRPGETRPRLRFPEFRNAPEWEQKKAGSFFANRKERGEPGLPIYSVTMNDGMVKRSSLDRVVDDIAEPAGNTRAYRNDIAYNMMRMWQGAFGVAVEDCMVSPAYVVLSPAKGVSPQFFGYLLKLPDSLRLLTSHSQGLTKDRLRLYYKDFAHIPLRCPSLREQRKIAGVLSSVDELIAPQIARLDCLQTHKKGLMQQLFPSPESKGSSD